MAETMNLGPEWMKNSSGANQSSGPVPRTPTTPTVPNSFSCRKFALAEFRYGKEDILALYTENNVVSGSILQSVSLVTSEIVKPMAFLPFSEEEQLLFSGCVNSSNSLRLIGRGGGLPHRGGRGGRGRGRGRGGGDGGYYHRSYSYDEQASGGATDHFNRPPMDGSNNRGGYEYVRGRGGGGARSGWNNNWRDSSHNPEDERWNSGTNSRWSLSSPGTHHPGRSDSGWRNRDESKKDSLLPEWAQQDSTDGKSSQKENSNGNTTPSTEPTVKDVPPAADKIDRNLSPVDLNDKDTPLKRPEKIVEPQSEVLTAQPVSAALRTEETVSCNVEDKTVNSIADVNEKMTSLNPIVNNVLQPARNEPAQLGKSRSNGHHEEPFSPDGFTQFEKQAEDLLLTEEEETPSSSPITLTGGTVADTLLASAMNTTLTFTNSHTRLHQQPQNNPMQITPPVTKQINKPATLPTPSQPAIEEFYTWFYQDPDGMIQGPFTSGEMKEWFDAGYFTMDLMVRRACDHHMLPLGQVIQMWKRIPFITEGKQPPPVKNTEPFWKPLMQRQPLLFQPRQQPQQMSLQTHAATTNSDLASTTESIWGRGAMQEKAMPSTQWPNIESVWEQSQSSPENYEEDVRRVEQEKQRLELEKQKKLEEEQRRKEEVQRRLEEEIKLKKQQEMEAKALKEAKERQERERIRLLEKEKRHKEEEAEQERERQRQIEQERLSEWKRNEEAKKSLLQQQQRQQQQQQEEERRLREQQQQASMETSHEHLKNHPQNVQQQVWSLIGPPPVTTSQPTGASLLQIQQQEEARLKKQQMIQEQMIRAQMAAAQQAAQTASAGWMNSKGIATSPTTGKSFLEIQLEQQKTAISIPPPAPKQSGTAWNNPGSSSSGHAPARNTSSSSNVWQNQPAVQQRLPRTSESDDDFWDLCMKDIPAAHRPTSLPQSRSSQTKTVAVKQKKMDKHEERIRRIFATPSANDDLIDWCESQFAAIHTELDAATFANFLLQFDSPQEVHEYVKDHIGDTPASKEFTRQFLERANKCKPQKTTNMTSGPPSSMPQVNKSKLTQQQEEAYPLPGSTVPSRSSGKQENGSAKPSAGTPTTPVGPNGGGKKKKKGKMQKIDPAAILGFSVNAAERPNAGEIQSVHDAH